MRILHVTDTFLPRVGGIELHVADLAARQQAAGHDVLVLTGEAMLRDRTAEVGVPVQRVELGVPGAGGGAAVGRVVAAFQPDVLHAHLTVGSPFTWSVLRRTKGTPTLASVHSLLPPAPRLVRAGMRLVGLPTGRMTFTAVSEVAAARLRPALPPGVRVGVLHNGIDPSAWQVPHVPTGEFSILSVGRLVPRKRPLVLVEALAQLEARLPGLAWQATIVGGGSQQRQVGKAIRAHGLEDRVSLLGTQTRGEIRGHLAAADVLVAPARLESFGIAALEGRCAGVPIIGMAASGVTEFVDDGVDGLLARSDDDLSRQLARLASDPTLTAAIRHHNTTMPVAMTWDRVVEEHDAAYRAVVGRTAVAV